MKAALGISRPIRAVRRYGAGIALCGTIGLGAWVIQEIEEWFAGRALTETLVLTILLGAVVRTCWKPGPEWEPGIGFSARELLEVAVLLLGASVNLPMLVQVGPTLLIVVLLVVAVALVASYALARLVGLGHKLAILVASGNSICGNSAIVAVASVIGASAEDVASSIAFTATLGVVLVLSLPLLIPVAGLTELQYGVLAGLAVYAVPQVIAATFPVSFLSGQIGTAVKLLRVLLLGPLVLLLALWHRDPTPQRRLRLHQLLPWFITGFLLLATLRSLGLLPAVATQPLRSLATGLTVISMAGLGLGVDIRALRQVGSQVTLAVIGSLVLLVVVSLVLIKVLRIG